MDSSNFEFRDFFYLAFKRDFPNIIKPIGTNIINFGCGNSPIEGAINYDIDSCGGKAILLDMNEYPYDIESDSADCIHCYHVLEHMLDPLSVISEFARIIKDKAPINIGVPFYKSQIAFHDLSHKNFWTEDTIRNHFKNQYSESYCSLLKENFSLIVGLQERNLMVFIQLYKEAVL